MLKASIVYLHVNYIAVVNRTDYIIHFIINSSMSNVLDSLYSLFNAYFKFVYVTLFWKTDHVVTFSISRNTDFKY